MAALRAGSLALPIGLHCGGNWAGQWLFGFGLPAGAGGRNAEAVWVATVSGEQLRAVVAPDLGPHLPYLGALAITVAIVMWGWRPAQASAGGGDRGRG
jgi:hypothetical protein